ncbi:MAG: PEP-CTERM-box response regulator transcription factor [Opitutaceae bacterium]|nr:PEP-CTERM-box response regulator transcription factor [Opitutaceae bacterium]
MNDKNPSDIAPILKTVDSSAPIAPAKAGGKPRLLIVEDDEEIRTQMRWALTAEYSIATAGDRANAVEQFRLNKPPVVLLDLGLPPHPGTPEEGLATITELLSIDRTTKIIVVSGQGEKGPAMTAIGLGAYDFVTKPAEMDELRFLLKRCYHVAHLEKEYRQMQETLGGGAFEGLLGSGARMQAVFDSIRKVATSDAPVLVLGESGTGKEVTARAIHQRSARRDGPFVAINCSAIPETLIESELFGHEKGAFTGAHAQRKGRIEQADGGTLFLDEIGEVPLPIQVKLLRFLQERVIERVGGRASISIDTRVLAATNADLKKGMAGGTFREDLFYRLAVVQIILPPLRDRNDDTLLLAQAFLKRYGDENGKAGLVFGADAVRAIRAHPWPGNVRELQNRVRRAVIMSEGKRIAPGDLELEVASGPTPGSTLKEARDKLEAEMIRASLARHAGRITAVAAELGVSRPTLYELVDRHGIQRPE